MLVWMFGNKDFTSSWNIPITTFELPFRKMDVLWVIILKQVIRTGSYAKTKHVL
nr:hypothetical protein [uncultured Sphaerochaeta sp.]